MPPHRLTVGPLFRNLYELMSVLHRPNSERGARRIAPGTHDRPRNVDNLLVIVGYFRNNRPPDEEAAAWVFGFFSGGDSGLDYTQVVAAMAFIESK